MAGLLSQQISHRAEPRRVGLPRTVTKAFLKPDQDPHLISKHRYEASGALPVVQAKAQWRNPGDLSKIQAEETMS